MASINLEPTDVPNVFRWTDYNIFYRLTDDSAGYWASGKSATGPWGSVKGTNPAIISDLIAASQALQGKTRPPGSSSVTLQASGEPGSIPWMDKLVVAENLPTSKAVPGDYIGLPVPKQAGPYLAAKREHTPRPGCWSFRALPEEVDFARIVREFNEACPGQDMMITLQQRRKDKRGRVRVVVSTPWRGKQAQERPKMTSWKDSHGDTWIPGPTRDEVVWMFSDSDGDPSCRRLSWLFASEETHDVSWRKHIKQAFTKLWGRTE